jgi:hypothetical protein
LLDPLMADPEHLAGIAGAQPQLGQAPGRQVGCLGRLPLVAGEPGTGALGAPDGQARLLRQADIRSIARSVPGEISWPAYPDPSTLVDG